MKTTKTQKLQLIAEEISNLIKQLPESNEFKSKLFNWYINVSHGKLEVKYVSYQKESKINLEEAEEWLKNFKIKPQRHFNSVDIIKKKKQKEVKEKVNTKNNLFYVVDFKYETITKYHLVQETKLLYHFVQQQTPNFTIKINKDQLGRTLFTSKNDAINTLVKHIDYQINKLNILKNQLESSKTDSLEESLSEDDLNEWKKL